MIKNNKEQLLEQYSQLARKLGKLPSKREIRKFISDPDKFYKQFDNLGNLRKELLSVYPDLENLAIPAELNKVDVEEYRLSLEKKSRISSNKTLVQDVSTLEYIEQFAERVFQGRIVAGKKAPKNFVAQRTHTLILSDLHFGADIKGDETAGTDFGITEESRKFASIIKAAAEYKPQYRNNTKLVIACLGDFIENMMHDARTGAVISEQICRAIHLLSQGIAYLANHYPSVEVVWSTGNHDRITSRHPKRAVHQKYDSYGTIIAYSVKMALKNVPNVKLDITKQVYGVYEVYGKKIGYTHGDTFLNPGNPYASVNVKGLENQINKLNAALSDKDEFAAFLYGHTHIGHTVYLPNGCVLIGNGGLPPSDHFGVSLGSLEANNGQWIFESVPGYAVGDSRYLRAGKEVENDESLDNIIKPFKSFND